MFSLFAHFNLAYASVISYTRTPSGSPIAPGSVNFAFYTTTPTPGSYVQVEVDSSLGTFYTSCDLYSGISYNTNMTIAVSSVTSVKGLYYTDSMCSSIEASSDVFESGSPAFVVALPLTCSGSDGYCALWYLLTDFTFSTILFVGVGVGILFWAFGLLRSLLILKKK